jgi:hypothetical protein
MNEATKWIKKKAVKKEGEQYTLHSVMPSYLQQVEKEAYGMIQKYGKKRAKGEAILTAESYIDDINNLEYYDANKIDVWDKSKFFWLDVAMKISNWE